MDAPKMFETYQAAPDVHVIPSCFPVPGMGILPINAFVLMAREPVLVDTGQALVSDQFIGKLSSVIDPPDIKWLFLTHVDPDHIGSLARMLEIAPKMRIITTFLAVGKMGLFMPLPIDRVYLLNPGQTINVGDRTLTAVKPAAYDAPETTGFFDTKSAALFSADSFGALMEEPADNAAAIGRERLREGVLTWTTVDSPWLRIIDRTFFTSVLDGIRTLAPKTILSSHLPPAYNMTDELLEMIAAVPDQEPFVGPDQQALEAVLRGRKAA